MADERRVTKAVTDAIVAVQSGVRVHEACDKLSHAELLEFMHRYTFGYDEADKLAVVQSLLRAAK